MAILHFHANSIGAATIGIASDPSDLNQGLIYADLPYGAISASQSIAVVSEPTTLPLFALAIAAPSLLRYIMGSPAA